MRAFPLVVVIGVCRVVWAAPPVAPPDAKGAYDVGTTRFSAVMSDGPSSYVMYYAATADDGSGPDGMTAGTGLSIVQALVRDELHGSFDLRRDGGTRAEVVFPA